MPPLIIHKGARVGPTWADKARNGTRVRVSQKGYITAELFHYWSRMFAKHIHKLKDNRKRVLLLDKHAAHVYNLDFYDAMRDVNVEVSIL